MNASRNGLLTVVLLGTASLATAGPVRALLGQGAAAGASSTAIAAGEGFTCGLIGDGTVRCWGTNLFGQLGNEASGVAFNPTPVQASGLADAVGLGAGEAHACALRASGVVACWGDNSIGQLGADPQVVPMQSTPAVVANVTNAVAIATGAVHSCALKSDGTAVCWGGYPDGELGSASAPRTWIARPVDGLSNAIALAAGDLHTCALLANGTVSCWGRIWVGQPGIGPIGRVYAREPVPVAGLNNVVSLAAGLDYTCAHRAGGTVHCWGGNDVGQLGDGTLDPSPVPVAAGGLSDAAAISVGKDGHTCVLRSDHSVRCWGRNASGQLGNENIASPQPMPVTVSGLTNAVALAAGSTHTCALTASGGTVCWGNNDFGQLGDGSPSQSSTPVSAALTRSVSAVQLVSGSAHNCALRSDGNVACWGSNEGAELGQATTVASSATPVAVAGLSGGAVALGAGSGFGCALRVGGTVSCWGRNNSGQLGRGTLSSAEPTPAPVIGDLVSVVALSEGSMAAHACAVDAGGRTRCWGSNSFGQLGKGTTGPAEPKPVIADTKGAVQVVVGDAFTCLLYPTGEVACTGANKTGQLGDGTTTPRSSPKSVSGLANVTALAAGGGHACALQANGTVRCWGRNLQGQLGTGSTNSFSSVPVPVVGVSGAVAITAQSSSTCALLADGTARCWGSNDVGQLGDGTIGSPRLSPQAVRISVPNATGRLASLLSASGGDSHGCALQSSGAPFCWGGNKSGQAGQPVAVSVTSAREMPSFRFNISPAVALRSPGRVATVTALLNCPEDQQAKVEITLRQRSAVGHGIGMRKCSGGIARYEFTVPARGREPFVAGPADVQAEAVVLDHGTPVDTQSWTRKVTVSVTP